MLRTVVREWGRIGLVGFGGPPAHVVLLRELAVERREWLTAQEFEDANAACGLLPGPGSTQMAIYTAGRVAGRTGALVGGVCFIAPGITAVLALSVLFLGGSPPDWVRGAGAGAGAAVAAVAVHAALLITRPAWARTGHQQRFWFAAYALAGAICAALLGAIVVVVLLGCGLAELGRRHAGAITSVFLTPVAAVGTGGLGALAWTALKVGALSYGGGFVIVPLMQHDAVAAFGWMTDAQFLNAVALGQITPGPVTATITAIGYAAHGVGGALLASVVAFSPSFAFILIGSDRFDRLRDNTAVRAFLDGAAPAAAGAIFGAALPLAGALHETWQLALLGAAGVALLAAHRGVVQTLLCAGTLGGVIALAGGPLP